MAYIAVKVYRNNEIRRLILERDDDNRFNFQRLLHKIDQVFPDLGVNGKKLLWKDADGELIRMSSTAELNEAIRSLPIDHQILRIYLNDSTTTIENQQETPKPREEQPIQIEDEQQEKMQTDQQQEPIDPNLHRNVFCDGCKGTISGRRYKCLTCPDYDLCSICIDKSIHDEHPTIRIVSPDDKTWKPAFFASQGVHGFGRRFGPGGRWGGSGRGHHGHCKRHGQNEEKEKMDASATTEGENPKNEQMFTEEFTRNIGQTLTNVLGAFGIPVEAFVQPPTQEAATASAGATTTEGAASASATNPNLEAKIASALNLLLGGAASPAAAAAGQSDQKIEAALNYMLAMGYTNEGGWLTKLLEEKRGDVSAVLDILHPQQNQ